MSWAAINEPTAIHAYGPEVRWRIRQRQPDSYRLAAEQINASRVDVVSLQHEFSLYGIWGDPLQDHLPPFLETLRKPLITTLHTVLPNPSPSVREAVAVIGEHSRAVVAMAELARQMLVETYGIDPAKVRVIPHGVPPTEPRGRRRLKEKLDLRGRTIVSTFGLLDPRKGLEYMIRAMETVIEHHPNALYLVVGKTHPDLTGALVRPSDELCELIEQRGLDSYVAFVDEYLTQRQIVDYLLASDVYVTPYLDPFQITSGTLAYALGAGKAIVSTPYLHATEALSDGRGVLVDFRSEQGLADAVLRILDAPAFKQQLEEHAYAYGREMAWPRVGERMLELFRDVADVPTISTEVGRWTYPRSIESQSRDCQQLRRPAPVGSSPRSNRSLERSSGGFGAECCQGTSGQRETGRCQIAGRAELVTRAFAVRRDPTASAATRPVPGAGPGVLAIATYAEARDGRYEQRAAAEQGFEGVACVDDGARAAILYCSLWRRNSLPRTRVAAEGLLRFLAFMQDEHGGFANFILDWDGNRNVAGQSSFVGGGPWWARAMHALAHGVATFGVPEYAERFERGLPWLDRPTPYLDVRAVAILAVLEYWSATGALEGGRASAGLVGRDRCQSPGRPSAGCRGLPRHPSVGAFAGISAGPGWPGIRPSGPGGDRSSRRRGCTGAAGCPGVRGSDHVALRSELPRPGAVFRRPGDRPAPLCRTGGSGQRLVPWP